jgi:hypothetical protein
MPTIDDHSENILIKLLKDENDISIKKLKQVFRTISKQVHPDITKNKQDYFIKLKRDFDEALAMIRDGRLRARERLNTNDAREALLKNLYLFALKIFTKQADALLAKIIMVSADYDENINKLLRRYTDEFYGNREQWMHAASIYYSHNIFIVCIKQLFQYYNTGQKFHYQLFKGYKQAVDGWGRNIQENYKEILHELYLWLESELDKDPIEYYG